MPEVAVIAGSVSDQAIVDKATTVLQSYNISFDVQIISAHRDAEKLYEYVKSSDAQVFICIADMPAIQMNTCASDDFTYSYSFSASRCAEMIWTSKEILYD